MRIPSKCMASCSHGMDAGVRIMKASKTSSSWRCLGGLNKKRSVSIHYTNGFGGISLIGPKRQQHTSSGPSTAWRWSWPLIVSSLAMWFTFTCVWQIQKGVTPGQVRNKIGGDMVVYQFMCHHVVRRGFGSKKAWTPSTTTVRRQRLVRCSWQPITQSSQRSLWKVPPSTLYGDYTRWLTSQPSGNSCAQGVVALSRCKEIFGIILLRDDKK